MEKFVDTIIPIKFEKVEDYDSRFQKVKIWLMHLGKNYNRSYFEKEYVLNALNTLKNTPILGYIKESELGEKDFAGHEIEIVVEDGKLKEKYLGRAFGVIGESCNPRFEFKEGDNGEILEYLVVDGILWTKFDDAISILERNGEVSQSMELGKDYEGYWDEDGYFHFTKFSFDGACMLGENVSPAMQKASVEISFSKEQVREKVYEKLQEFYSLFGEKNKEVNNRVLFEELLKRYSISIEDLKEKGVNIEEYSSEEELEDKIKEIFNSTDDTELKTEDEDKDSNLTDENNDEPETNNSQQNSELEDKFVKTFELSHDDIRSRLYAELNKLVDKLGKLGKDFYIDQVFDDYFIVNDWNTGKFYKLSYNKEGDNVSVEEQFEEVFPMFLTLDEKNALELMRTNFKKYESEIEELREFKSQVMQERKQQEINDLFARPEFSVLTEDDLCDIKDKVNEFSVQELESKLYEILGRKNATKFSKSKKSDKDNTIKINFNADVDSGEFSSPYAHILKKYKK